MLKTKNILKIRTISIMHLNILVLNIAQSIKDSAPKKFPIFHNGSNYDYHFIMEGLEEEF